MKYFTNIDGKFTEVVDIDTICDSLRNIVESAERRAETAKAELEDMKRETWKDEQLSNMRKQVEEYRLDCLRGFPISEREEKAILKWKDKHYTNQHNAPDSQSRIQMQGVSGGLFTYVFLPTSLGVSGVCRCNSCYAKAMKEVKSPDQYKARTDYWTALDNAVKKYDAEFQFQEIG